jgi:transcriptional regulator with PAS, ATPase and Fis domain
MVTTRRDLGPEVEAERFRQDLFYRLSVMPLALPAAAANAPPDDRAGLIATIHASARGIFPDGPPMITPMRWGGCSNIAWPGNIREWST